ISALKGTAVKNLQQEVKKNLPLHPPFYDPELLTEQPERFFVSEFIREQLFIRYKDEIPYSTEVEIEEFKERETGKTYIRAVIYVERDSQKGILIGKGGSALKKIGEFSRKQIEDFLDRKIFLELFVKVLPNWRNDSKQLKRLGY
ncbi:MAG: GTPase Era, partial [Calditrichaeota bacterium]|nr:GTPase Era [Calditrichota bacterium]